MRASRLAIGLVGLLCVVAASEPAGASDGTCFVNVVAGLSNSSDSCPPAPAEVTWSDPSPPAGESSWGSGFADFGLVAGSAYSTADTAAQVDLSSQDLFRIDGPIPGELVAVTAQFAIDYSVNRSGTVALFHLMNGAAVGQITVSGMDPTIVCRLGFLSSTGSQECVAGGSASGSDTIEVDFDVIEGSCFALDMDVYATASFGLGNSQNAYAAAHFLDPPVIGFDPRYTLKQCNGDDVVPVPEPNIGPMLIAGSGALLLLGRRGQRPSMGVCRATG